MTQDSSVTPNLPVRDIARALVFDPDDRLLLIAYEAVRPIDPAAPEARTFWFMPGGGLEPGETHVEACRRELSEEIGVTDAAIGPQVASCDGPFHLFKTPRFARERYFVVRLPDATVDTSRLAETEDNPVLGTRWWTLDELESTAERIEPAGLAQVARDVVAGRMPAPPVALAWQSPSAGTPHEGQPSTDTPTEDSRMFPETLKSGYRSFIDGRLPDEAKRYAKLAQGQSPEVLMISCCDSRVSPEVIFDTGPGELFVIRNVANIVPPCETGGDFHGTSAAIEFAVQGLEVKHIVVLGHASCGGIKAYANPSAPLSKGDFIGKWVSLVGAAAKKAGDQSGPDYLTRLEYAMVAQSLENLMTFPFVRSRVMSGRLALHGAHFGIARGELLLRDPDTGVFKPAIDREGRSLSPTSLIGCFQS